MHRAWCHSRCCIKELLCWLNASICFLANLCLHVAAHFNQALEEEVVLSPLVKMAKSWHAICDNTTHVEIRAQQNRCTAFNNGRIFFGTHLICHTCRVAMKQTGLKRSLAQNALHTITLKLALLLNNITISAAHSSSLLAVL